ncbi:hypothetical protein GCM10023335_56870 [Streptomyces siamensis]|uniref:Uncharacterized protein n=1 Tax=Streptomyces siamensis TaxID=1274986 RepID=A0ABP9J874_9ACTN
MFAVAAVDADLPDRGMSGRCLFEEGLACYGVQDAGRGDQDGEQKAEEGVCGGVLPYRANPKGPCP